MRFHAGDFFHDELPAADVYLLGNLLVNWEDERCELLVGRAAAALPPGGALLLYDAFLEHTTERCARWLAGAGLVDIAVRPLLDPTILVTGVKPSG
jgi:O-methyltransferase domain